VINYLATQNNLLLLEITIWVVYVLSVLVEKKQIHAFLYSDCSFDNIYWQIFASPTKSL